MRVTQRSLRTIWRSNYNQQTHLILQNEGGDPNDKLRYRNRLGTDFSYTSLSRAKSGDNGWIGSLHPLLP